MKRNSSETKRHDHNNLMWAIGFYEAEGSLLISNGRIIIGACQATNNIKVLYKLKSIFKMGRVKIRKDTRYADWKLKPEERYEFMELINGKLVTQNKQNYDA